MVMISIVIPVYNEHESVEDLYKELEMFAEKLRDPHEIIFIDDGSTDDSLTILKKLAEKDSTVRIFSFRKNQGKAEALTFGFQKAKGDIIVTLDADLQDKPSEIPKLLKKMQEGYEVVCGWREKRQDIPAKKILSKIFNRLVKMFWGLSLHDYNCGLKAYTKEAAKSLRLYGGLHRFIPLLLYQKGFRITEVPVIHEKRKFGISKFGISKVWKDLPDIFTMLFLARYSKRPMHFFGTIGSILIFLGVIILGYLWIIQLQGQSIGRRPLLFVGFFAIIGGLQIFFTGFLADIMINLSHQESINEMQRESFSLRYTTDKEKK